ncbi:putative retrotransposon gag domain, aspartic peptidase domain protein [Tanacetum coccineum]
MEGKRRSRKLLEALGQDNARQNPKNKGTSKDVMASLDKRVAGVETSMADLKNQVEGLDGLDSDFTIIEDLQADMPLYKRSLASGGGNPNHGLKIDVLKPSSLVGKREARTVDDFLWEMEQYLEGVNVVDDASKIKMATRYLKDTAALWWRRRYGDIERGTATIDTWAEFVADFKKQFYPENAKNKAKSQLRKLKQSGRYRRWAKSELERRGVQDLSTAIAHAEDLIDFSTRRESSKLKDRKVNQEKCGGEKNTQPKVDPARKPPTRNDKNLKTSYKSGGCFICDGPHRARDCPKKASLNGMSAHEDEEASDGESMGSMRILNAIKAKTEVPKVVGKGLQYVEATINGVKVHALVDPEGTIDLAVVLMDDFKVVLGLEFLDRVRAFPMPFANSLCILDGGNTCMVSTDRDAKSGAKTLSAMQFKKGFNKNEPCYLAVTRLETDEGLSKMEVPKVIEWVLDEFKDVMPKELPKKLPPRR